MSEEKKLVKTTKLPKMIRQKNSDLSTTYKISHIIGVDVNLSVTKMRIPIDFIIFTGCTVECGTSGMIPMTSCYNVHKCKKYIGMYFLHGHKNKHLS